MIFSFGPRGLITYELLGLKGVTVYGLTSTLLLRGADLLSRSPTSRCGRCSPAIDSNVEGMALSLGASRWRVFRTVTLPLAIPGLANAFLLLFAASLADFATPLILAGNQFPGAADAGVPADHRPVRPARRRGAVVRAAACRRCRVPAAALLGEPPLLRHRHRQGRGADAVRQRLARRARARCSALCALVTLVIVYFYALLLYASLVVALGANHTFTLQHYHVIFTDGLKAIRDTLIIAGLRDAARRPLRHPARLSRHARRRSSAGARWSSCR